MCLPFTKRDPLKDQFQKKIYFLGCFIFILFLYYILKICCTYVLNVPIENWNSKSQPEKIRNNDGTIHKLILCSGFFKFILVHFSNGRINVYQKQVETGNYFFFDNKWRFEVGELLNQKMLLLYSMYYWSNQPTRRRQMRMKNTISGLDVVSRLSFRGTEIYFQESHLENWLEPVCCKKQQNWFLTSYWFVE